LRRLRLTQNVIILRQDKTKIDGQPGH